MYLEAAAQILWMSLAIMIVRKDMLTPTMVQMFLDSAMTLSQQEEILQLLLRRPGQMAGMFNGPK